VKQLPRTPALLAVARRVIWFEPAEEALNDPARFLAHVMTYGTIEDLAALVGVIDLDDYRAALDAAPPGIFDARSWAYWNLRCGRQPAPPLPSRVAYLDAGVHR
jgi:hypothetical protein